jgi:phosphoglycolate phosphatase
MTDAKVATARFDKTMRVSTVLFDLDGTLADTAPDLGYAINALLAEHQRPPLPFEAIRPVASHGSPGLIKLAFGITSQQPEYESLRKRFLELYAARVCHETVLFTGMSDVLAALAVRKMKWGVVTNKPAFLTEPLLRILAPTPPPVCIVSGDSTRNRKPHPEPMLLACKQAGVEPGECVFVGDAERDIQAGRDAGMQTLVALFGYISEDDKPQDWGADAMIHHPRELIGWLDAR